MSGQHVVQRAVFTLPPEIFDQLIFDCERRCFRDSRVHKEHFKLAMVLADIVVGGECVVVRVDKEFEEARAGALADVDARLAVKPRVGIKP